MMAPKRTAAKTYSPLKSSQNPPTIPLRSQLSQTLLKTSFSELIETVKNQACNFASNESNPNEFSLVRLGSGDSNDLSNFYGTAIRGEEVSAIFFLECTVLALNTNVFLAPSNRRKNTPIKLDRYLVKLSLDSSLYANAFQTMSKLEETWNSHPTARSEISRVNHFRKTAADFNRDPIEVSVFGFGKNQNYS